jgi:hypothetical protein
MKRLILGLLLALASCGVIPIPAAAQGQRVTSVNGSTTITAGGSFQTVLSANPDRHGCLIQNPATATETLYVSVGQASPTTAASVGLAPGATFSCNVPGYVIADAIQVEAATTGHAFVLVSQ